MILWYFTFEFLTSKFNLYLIFIQENEGLIKSVAETKLSGILSDESEIGSTSNLPDINFSKSNSIETRNKVRSVLRRKFGKYQLI